MPKRRQTGKHVYSTSIKCFRCGGDKSLKYSWITKEEVGDYTGGIEVEEKASWGYSKGEKKNK